MAPLYYETAPFRSKGKSIRIKGGEVGILMIHGFNGTPSCFQEIGERLSELGYSVSAPLLAGHGSTLEDFSLSRWEDWYASAEEAYAELAKECGQIFLVGASLGSNIACALSTKHPVQGIVLIGMPRWLFRQWIAIASIPFLKALRIRYVTMPKVPWRKNSRKTALNAESSIAYPFIPTVCMQEFFRVTGPITDSVLHRVSAPALIIQSSGDGLVKPSSGTYVYDRISSPDKQLVWITESHHRIHNGRDKDEVFEQALHFIRTWQRGGQNAREARIPAKRKASLQNA